MYREGKGSPARNKYWSKEAFLKDLSHSGTIKGVCLIYADEEKGWKAYYLDVSRWRKDDPVFEARVREALTNSENTQKAGPGRDNKDGGDHSWWDDFCEELYAKSGNRHAASLVTPYSFGAIRDMLNPESTTYNKEFADRVETTEAEMAAEIEELFLGVRKPENFATFNDAKVAQTKAWYAIKALEKLDKRRYGKYVEVKGSMTHEHKHQLMPPSERMFNLWEEQKKFLQTKATHLIASSAGVVESLPVPEEAAPE